jgi:hypothetical protein
MGTAGQTAEVASVSNPSAGLASRLSRAWRCAIDRIEAGQAEFV